MYRFPPEDLLEGSRTYSNNGYTLTVAFGIDYENPASKAPLPSGKSGLYVAVSDCPTRDCVRTGIITQSGQSIVCLPDHRPADRSGIRARRRGRRGGLGGGG